MCYIFYSVKPQIKSYVPIETVQVIFKQLLIQNLVAELLLIFHDTRDQLKIDWEFADNVDVDFLCRFDIPSYLFIKVFVNNTAE